GPRPGPPRSVARRGAAHHGGVHPPGDGPGRAHRDRRRAGGDGGRADGDARCRRALSRDPQGGGAGHPAPAASPRRDAPAPQAPLPGVVQRLARAGGGGPVLRVESTPVSRLKRKMHLAQFLCHGPTYHSLAMWRHPRTAEAGCDGARPELYQHIARVCERGKFDMVFFADLNYISDTYRGTMDPAIRYATQAPEHDPVPLLSFMAAVTTHIGLGSTFSISHSHPFYAARMWATLDHLTRGRAASNVVTSLNHTQSANYGEERRPTEERYDRAHEFIEVCRKLWASWEPDAVVMDRSTGVVSSRIGPSCTASSTRVGSSSRGGRSMSCGPHRAVRRSYRPARRPRGGRSRRGTRMRSSRSSRTYRAPNPTTPTSRAAPGARPASPTRAGPCSAPSRSSARRRTRRGRSRHCIMAS